MSTNRDAIAWWLCGLVAVATGRVRLNDVALELARVSQMARA